jgi:hypothetical protein
MIWLAVATLLLAAGDSRHETQPPGNASHPIRLEAGDFRWMPFTVRHTPSEVDCSYAVVQGGGTVHVELLPMSEFRAFSRGRGHDTIALTPDGRSGEFKRIIEQRGQYAVVLENAPGAHPVSVVLDVRTNVTPGADIAQTLSDTRRLIVIGISFAFFFGTLAWSGHRLLRAARL